MQDENMSNSVIPPNKLVKKFIKHNVWEEKI